MDNSHSSLAGHSNVNFTGKCTCSCPSSNLAPYFLQYLYKIIQGNYNIILNINKQRNVINSY